MVETGKPLRLFVPLMKNFSDEARAAALAARQAKLKGKTDLSVAGVQEMGSLAVESKASHRSKASEGELRMSHEMASSMEAKAAIELKEAQKTKDETKIKAAETKWADALKLKVETGLRLEDHKAKEQMKGHAPIDNKDEGGDYNKFLQSVRGRHR